jgi:hypothetical protein
MERSSLSGLLLEDLVTVHALEALMFTLEAGKSSVSDAIHVEDAKDIRKGLGKMIKLKKK